MSEVPSQLIQTKAYQTKRFLEDHQGQPSSMRLMSMIALMASIVFGLISTLHSEASNNENGLFITCAFLIAAFAPKAVQKFAEIQFPPMNK